MQDSDHLGVPGSAPTTPTKPSSKKNIKSPWWGSLSPLDRQYDPSNKSPRTPRIPRFQPFNTLRSPAPSPMAISSTPVRDMTAASVLLSAQSLSSKSKLNWSDSSLTMTSPTTHMATSASDQAAAAASNSHNTPISINSPETQVTPSAARKGGNDKPLQTPTQYLSQMLTTLTTTSSRIGVHVSDSLNESNSHSLDSHRRFPIMGPISPSPSTPGSFSSPSFSPSSTTSTPSPGGSKSRSLFVKRLDFSSPGTKNNARSQSRSSQKKLKITLGSGMSQNSKLKKFNASSRKKRGGSNRSGSNGRARTSRKKTTTGNSKSSSRGGRALSNKNSSSSHASNPFAVETSTISTSSSPCAPAPAPSHTSGGAPAGASSSSSRRRTTSASASNASTNSIVTPMTDITNQVNLTANNTSVANTTGGAAGGAVASTTLAGGGPIVPDAVPANGTIAPNQFRDTTKFKPCNCKKSKCLKLYCECFARQGFCYNCNCTNCHNIPKYKEIRHKAIQATIERDPDAFFRGSRTGIINGVTKKHRKGCHCKKSECLKKYCECFQAGIPCSDICKCVGCRNGKCGDKKHGSSGGTAVANKMNESKRNMRNSRKMSSKRSSNNNNNQPPSKKTKKMTLMTPGMGTIGSVSVGALHTGLTANSNLTNHTVKPDFGEEIVSMATSSHTSTHPHPPVHGTTLRYNTTTPVPLPNTSSTSMLVDLDNSIISNEYLLSSATSDTPPSPPQPISSTTDDAIAPASTPSLASGGCAMAPIIDYSGTSTHDPIGAPSNSGLFLSTSNQHLLTITSPQKAHGLHYNTNTSHHGLLAAGAGGAGSSFEGFGATLTVQKAGIPPMPQMGSSLEPGSTIVN